MNPRRERLSVRLDTSLELLSRHDGTSSSDRILATIVATAGSTYQKAGARMLIMPDGTCAGLLSGGCLEADLTAHAQEVLLRGVPRVVEYDLRGPDEVLFGLGTGCEGAMRILLEPASTGSTTALALCRAARATRQGQPASLVMVHEAVALELGTYDVEAPLPSALREAADQVLVAAASTAFEAQVNGQRTRAFVQYLAPAPHLLVCGAGSDAVPVVKLACALGWHVTVVDHRPAYTDAGRFPGARVLHVDPGALRATLDTARCHAAVVMSHHLASDASYLRELAAAGAPGYVGLLGPAPRRTRLMHALGDMTIEFRDRLHSPVGLNLGAVVPEAIALAIISEIHAWLASCSPEY